MSGYGALVASVLVLSLIFAVLERLFPAEAGQRPGRWWFNVAYAPVGLAAVTLIGLSFSPLVTALLGAARGGLLPKLVGETSGPLALAGFALGYAFVWDLCQYAMHRVQHAVPALWETHRFHHDETALNAAAQTRVHPSSYVVAVIFHLPVLAFLGAQTPHAIATFMLFQLWGFVNHANLRLQLGPLTAVVSGPQWHRIHHSALKEHRDRNFATFFPVIDMAFGTYHRPERNEFPPTGLSGRRRGSLRSATVAPLEAWAAMVGRRLTSARR